MTSVVRYCRGCNEQFTVADDDRQCPACRHPLVEGDVAATVDLAETRALDADEAQRVGELEGGLVGRQLGGYTIESFLGRGGMAWVFRARHDTLLRPCAIKILAPELQERDPKFLEMFVAEARAAASLVHPNVVTVHNVGLYERFHFIEMEYVPGPSLASLVREAGWLSPLEATRMMLQVGAALDAAHVAGLVHRDIKPANVLVRDGQIAKLSDFGLAKRITGEPTAPTGERLTGTPYFMAPELFQGVRATSASDVYALGVTYYFLLTGQHPFQDNSLTAMGKRHAEQPIPDPRSVNSEIPDDVVRLIHLAMSKNPLERPRDGGEFHERLRAVFGEMQDLDALVHEALDGRPLAWTHDGNRIVVRVPTSGGRSQRVVIEDHVGACHLSSAAAPRDGETADGGPESIRTLVPRNVLVASRTSATQASPTAPPWAHRLIRIYSVCARADASYFQRALELNASIPHGSLAIDDIEGQPHFVMLNTYPRATCDPIEIRHSVEGIAKWADEIEHALTGLDQH